VVCTSTLDLGIDWGDVDLVINVGAPKGASRLMQRIGRANHRSTSRRAPCWSRPTVSRCWNAGPRSMRQLAEARRTRRRCAAGALDVLAQHVLGMACAAPFEPDALYAEVRTASPYTASPARTSTAVVDFVATGGYALKDL
jgi:ATP-dependent Lhr-like helicase